MQNILNLGTAKIDITPTQPVPLAGFSTRKELGSCEGVSHPLYARIFLFEQEDESGRKQKALLVSADLIWWGSDHLPTLKEQIKKKWGIEGDAVILHATHTHSGPQTSHKFTPLLGECDSDYLKLLEIKLMEGIDIACRNVELVSIERAIGSCDIGINRRKKIDDSAALMFPNMEGPTDHEVHVIRFLSTNGAPKGVLVHYACHPVITRENLVSSEFTGVAMELIEREMEGDAVAAFLQGCCGDINPKRGENFCFGQDAEVRLLGRKLADEVLNVFNRPFNRVLPFPLVITKKLVALPLEDLPTLAKLDTLKDQAGVVGEWSRLLLASPQNIVPQVQFELTLLQLGQGLSFLAMNSEIVVEYGLFLKEKFDNQILPIPYSNGMIGYTPTAKQLAEGGYESNESTLYFGLPAKFDPAIETIIRTEMTNWTIAEK